MTDWLDKDGVLHIDPGFFTDTDRLAVPFSGTITGVSVANPVGALPPPILTVNGEDAELPVTVQMGDLLRFRWADDRGKA